MSAGPNHLGNFKEYINNPTRIEHGTHISSGTIFNETLPMSKVKIKTSL